MNKLHPHVLVGVLADLIEYEQLEWDAPPKLIGLVNRQSAFGPLLFAQEIPTPCTIWSNSDPVDTLTLLASQVARNPAITHKVVPRSLVGVAFLHEGFAKVMDVASMSPEEIRQVHKDASNRRIRYRQDREEMRFLCAVDIARTRYLVTHSRETKITTPYVQDRLTRNVTASGAVLEALQTIITAFGKSLN
jgi:hypothetical protein